MKRSRLQRGPWRRKKNRAPRPGKTTDPAGNAAWKKLCLQIRERDGHRCRFCGEPAKGHAGQIDHIVPRRLLAGADAEHPDNLALLCTRTCHARKSHRIEPALYRGDVLSFTTFYLSLGEPFPPGHLRAAALLNLTRMIAESTA